MMNFLKAIGVYPRNCRVSGCESESFAKRFCRNHYREWVALVYPSSRDIKSSVPKIIPYKS